MEPTILYCRNLEVDQLNQKKLEALSERPHTCGANDAVVVDYELESSDVLAADRASECLDRASE